MRILSVTRFMILAMAGSTSIMAQTDSRQKENFSSFLTKFTTSAAFQYERIRFPLESPVILLDEEEKEHSFSFTKEMWSLLDEDALKVQRVELDDDGGVFIAKFVLDKPDRKEFEAGLEDSELDLRVVFQLIDGKWYVVDGVSGWFSSEWTTDDVPEILRQIHEENQLFISEHP